MKRLIFWSFVFSLAGMTACNKSERGGGPERSSQFTIEGPAMTKSIKQGDTETVALKINRGQEFKETVKLKTVAPSGIQVAVHESIVKPSDKGDVNLKVAVAKDVAPGEHIIHLTGTPDTGAGTSLDIKVKVTEQPSGITLRLQGPSSTTSIKQGEAQTIKITVELHDKLNTDVRLKIDVDNPKGITTELTPGSTIRPADKGVTNLRVTADKSASPGEHTIHITGTTDGATITPIDVKIKIIMP